MKNAQIILGKNASKTFPDLGTGSEDSHTAWKHTTVLSK